MVNFKAKIIQYSNTQTGYIHVIDFIILSQQKFCLLLLFTFETQLIHGFSMFETSVMSS